FDEFVFGRFKIEAFENFPLVNDVIVYAHASSRLRFLTLYDSKQFSENHTPAKKLPDIYRHKCPLS
ncbi:MAG: hypothetical protein WBM78_09540, partial [Desulfobacterales bacterium]